jgi:outer membrane protein OmpA-like peptidoglycan-associated protein
MKRSMQVASVTIAVGMAFAGGCAATKIDQGTTIVGVKAAEPPPPPAPPKRVQVTASRITISEKIHFELDKATILPDSDSLITEIADVIKANPQLKKIRIEGHASKDRPHEEKHDMKLSDERAKAVVAALVTKGVSASMLVSQGFGETVPLAGNDTEEGREQNRRVDFVILDPAPKN